MGRVYPEFLGGPRAVALLILRLAAGTAFVLHGWPKIKHPMSWMPPEAPIPGWLQGDGLKCVPLSTPFTRLV